MSFVECPKRRKGQQAKKARCWSFESEVDNDFSSWGDILSEEAKSPTANLDEDVWQKFDRFFTSTPEESGEEEIVDLYDRLAAINSQRIANPEDTGLTFRANELLGRIRTLQTQEGARIRARFERSLEMPIDAGKSLLDNVENLLMQYEDPSTNSSAS